MPRLHGCRGAAMYKDVLPGFLFLTNPKYLRPCWQCRGRMDAQER